MINSHPHYHSLFIEGLFFELFVLLYRIKRRTIEEMEQDLSREKIFDMTMHLRGISLILPENGVVYYGSSPMVHIDFDSLMLKSCLDNDDKDDNNLLSKV